MHRIIFLAACVTAAISPLSAAADFDVIIRGGLVFDGSGGDGKRVDVAIRGDRIAGVGRFQRREGKSDHRREGPRGRARDSSTCFPGRTSR